MSSASTSFPSSANVFSMDTMLSSTALKSASSGVMKFFGHSPLQPFIKHSGEIGSAAYYYNRDPHNIDQLAVHIEGRQVYGINSFYLLCVFTSIFIFIRNYVVNSWMKPYFERALRWSAGESIEKESKGKSAEERLEDQKTVDSVVFKLSKHFYHCVVYFCMFCWSMFLLHKLSWGQSTMFMRPSDVWNVTTYDSHSLVREFDTMQQLWLFMCIQCSWYLAGTIDYIVRDRQRSDFWMMIAHHLFAIYLIYGAFVMETHQYGIHVTAALDPADVGLYAAKVFHVMTSNPLTGKPISGASWITRIRCALLWSLVIIWIWARITVYGNIVVKSQKEWYIRYYTDPNYDQFGVSSKLLIIFLTLLLILQVVWGIFLTNMTLQQTLYNDFVDNVHNDFKKSADDEKTTEGDESKRKVTEDKKSGSKNSEASTAPSSTGGVADSKTEPDNDSSTNGATTRQRKATQ